MDFTLIEKRELGGVCYKLLKTNFYRNYYVIIAQDKNNFCCGSIYAERKDAHDLFIEIVESNTDIYTLSDILRDFSFQKI